MFKQYLYSIKYTVKEEALCKMEMKYLFNKAMKDSIILSDFHVEPNRSCFIKQCLSIIYTGDNLEAIVNQILLNKLAYDNFKVHFMNLNEDIHYAERRRIEYIVGYNINGAADVHNPSVLLGITKIKDMWILGELKENKESWKVHDNPPFSYSTALGVRTARALVNIIAGNDLSIKLVDPCCGIGTVVMEALSLGIDIKGFELNPYIAENAKKNLVHFGYKDVITNGNMHYINETFSGAIVDLPYGLFSPTTLEEQIDIIKTTRRIASKSIFITQVNMEQHFLDSGFKILDSCTIAKGDYFKRHITLCS